MSDTSARHGSPPTASVDSVQPSVKSQTSQPFTEPPEAGGAGTPDLTLVLVLAVALAIIIKMFWRALLGLAVIAGLTLVFTGILIPVMMMAPPR